MGNFCIVTTFLLQTLNNPQWVHCTCHLMFFIQNINIGKFIFHFISLSSLYSQRWTIFSGFTPLAVSVNVLQYKMWISATYAFCFSIPSLYSQHWTMGSAVGLPIFVSVTVLQYKMLIWATFALLNHLSTPNAEQSAFGSRIGVRVNFLHTKCENRQIYFSFLSLPNVKKFKSVSKDCY
jgi:hypothetical protein